MDKEVIEGSLNCLKTCKECKEEDYKCLRYSEVYDLIPKLMKIAKKEKAQEIFDDKELMLELCNCDRHEDVHLGGCRYLYFKETLTDNKKGGLRGKIGR